MILEYDEGNEFRQECYTIKIDHDEDINPYDVAESFKRQFIKKKAVILFSNVTQQVKIGMIFVGLNLKRVTK